MTLRLSEQQERASLLPTKQRRPSWHRQAKNVPRWIRWVLIIAILYGTAAFIRGISDMHDQNLKLRATDFTGLHSQGAGFWPPSHADRRRQGHFIDDRYRFVRHLASGKEGSVDVYVDQKADHPVVVKTYRTIPRNPIPHALLDKFTNFTSAWPTEIEAGLLLVNYSGFVPVLDYFVVLDDTRWSWALSSAFMSNGTLDNLAKEERLSINHTLSELDIKYRPSLISLLRELKPLHKAGLCHDDVKTDNVFIRSPEKWLLGDLGNMRHFSHAYHGTRTWKRGNQWANCHSNDIRRALKTYLWFLRSSTRDTAEFDRKFWAQEEEWSRMYWDFARNPADFEMIIETLPRAATDIQPTVSQYKSDDELARTTERELICTTIPRRLWPWYWKYAPIW